MKTYSRKPADLRPRKYVIDAEGQVLGRLASKVAAILMGKHTPQYQPGWPDGDKVLVVNADKVKVTGGKETKTVYRWHTNYPGGLKELRMDKAFEKDPAFPLIHAIKGMLPHNSRGRKLFRNLRVVCGPAEDHPGRKGAEVLRVKL